MDKTARSSARSGIALRAALFAGLTEAERAQVVAKAAKRELPAHRVLCREGEPADAMFLVQSGRIRFVRAAADGDETVLRWFGPGDCFGMGSLVPGPATYMGTAVTMSQARVYHWDAGAIQSAAAAFPRLGQNALRIVLEYLEEYIERHGALLSNAADHRLARTLTHLAAGFGQVQPDGVEIRIANRELASLADVGVFTVSRQLRHWHRHGDLVKSRQRLLIRHPEGLYRSFAQPGPRAPE